MATGREEAAPTFTTWKRRLSQVDISQSRKEVQQFIEVLSAVGTPMIDDLVVHFIYWSPRSNRVQLAGEFNQWGSRGSLIKLREIGRTGVYYHTLKLKSPGRLEYKFIVDGKWQTDPFCAITVDNGVGGRNSAFSAGDLEDPPELQTVPGIAHGRVEKFEFHSRRLGNSRRIYELPAAQSNDPGFGVELSRDFKPRFNARPVYSCFFTLPLLSIGSVGPASAGEAGCLEFRAETGTVLPIISAAAPPP